MLLYFSDTAHCNAWEQRKLGEIVQIQKGIQLGKKELLPEGEYYVLNGGTTPSGFTNAYNTEANTISISEGGNSCGFVNLNTVRYWSGGHNYTLNKPQWELEYLFALLKKNRTFHYGIKSWFRSPQYTKNRIKLCRFKCSI